MKLAALTPKTHVGSPRGKQEKRLTDFSLAIVAGSVTILVSSRASARGAARTALRRAWRLPQLVRGVAATRRSRSPARRCASGRRPQRADGADTQPGHLVGLGRPCSVAIASAVRRSSGTGLSLWGHGRRAPSSRKELAAWGRRSVSSSEQASDDRGKELSR
jgi:hypothetical protein